MQKTVYFILFAGVSIFTSCNTSNSNSEEKEVSNKNVVVSNSEDKKAEDSAVKKPLLKADEYLLALEELRILTIAKLKLATPQIENEEWDNRELMFNDAGLSISLEQFAWIVRRWERFVQKYPKSKLKPEAKELYGYYQSFYLFGLDNTPVSEHSDGKIYPENKANFEMFMSFYPESPTSKLIKTLMSLEGNYEAMSEAVIKQQNQLMNKM